MRFSTAFIRDFARKVQAEGDDLWSYVPQEFDSSDTSRKQKPSAITYLINKMPHVLKPNQHNLDIGGGRHDFGSNLLKDVGVTNYIYDPFNRTPEENELAANTSRSGKSPTVTVSNVLNVIREPEVRERVIKQAADAVEPINGVVIFSIYEGVGKDRGSRNSRVTVDKGDRKSWQNFFPASDYLPEIQKYFKDVVRKNNIIVAKGPIVSWR